MTTAVKPEPLQSLIAEWPYRFEIVPTRNMIVDSEYQRPLTTFHLRIAENFNPALVGTLILSQRRANIFAVVDGQSRLGGARKRVPEVPELPALVYLGLTVADEANLFALLQKERKGIASFHRFRAALVAGDEESRAIEKIVKRAGYEVGLGGSSPTAISAVAGLERAYRRSPDLLARTLTIFWEAWSDYVPSGDLIRGMAYLLDHKPEIDDERMARHCSVVTPQEIKRRASALREGGGHGGGSDKYIAGALEGIYSRRLPS